jgi:hypothetical protein
LDLVVANSVGPISVFLGNGDGTFNLGKPIYSAGKLPASVVIGDFNGDGKLDVAVANRACRNCSGYSGSISVFLGHGDGTFEKAVTYPLLGAFIKSMTVGDFRGNGKLDLAVADCVPYPCGGDAVGILLGNGDGTFQPEVPYGAGPGDCADSIVAADFNGDGKLDLALADPCEKFVSIVLGDGDGHFQPSMQYASGLHPWSIAPGDFNGDGKIDLAGALIYSSDAILLLGNGDGSFGTPADYPTGEFNSMAVAIGDFNQDGKLDLAVTSNCCGITQESGKTDGAVAILLGNGDGSFQLPVNYDSGGLNAVPEVQEPKEPVAVGDLNGDGRADLVVANQCADITCTSGSITVLLGNGDGTFQGEVVDSHYGTSMALTSAPNPSNIGQPVTFTATVTPAYTAIPDGELVTFYDGKTVIGTGALASGLATFTTSSLTVKTHTIKAIYAGDATFEPSSGTIGQVVEKYATTTGLTSSANPSAYRQTVTFTATVTQTGPYLPTGKVTFRDGTKVLASPTLNNGVATLSRSTLAVGTHAITAEYLGDVYNAASTSTVLEQVVQ